MEVIFEKGYLQEMYNTGKSSDKKHRFQPEIINKYIRVIDIMIANNIEPYCPTHPGEILKEEIEYRGISQRRLASEMDMSYSVLNEILNAKRPVNAEFALLIEAILGLEAEPLLKMQSRYNMLMAKRDNRFIEKLNKVRKTAAIL